MAVNKQQTFGDAPYTRCVQITSADGTTKKDLAAAESTGAGLRVDFLRVVTDLAADTNIEFFFYNATTTLTNPLGIQAVPASSGKDATVPVYEAMALALPDSILLAPGDKLQVAATGAITSGKTFWVTCLGMDLTSS